MLLRKRGPGEEQGLIQKRKEKKKELLRVKEKGGERVPYSFVNTRSESLSSNLSAERWLERVHSLKMDLFFPGTCKETRVRRVVRRAGRGQKKSTA